MAVLCPLLHANEKKGLCLHEKMLLAIVVLFLVVTAGEKILGMY